MLNSYIEFNIDVLHAASGNIYVDGDDKSLVNIGPIALFSNYKVTTSSGKHLKEISYSHNVSLMYKLLTLSRGSDDLSFGFDHDRDRRRREITKNRNIKAKDHVGIYL